MSASLILLVVAFIGFTLQSIACYSLWMDRDNYRFLFEKNAGELKAVRAKALFYLKESANLQSKLDSTKSKTKKKVKNG